MKYLRWDETLFKDETVFDPDYLPDALLHRDKQLTALAANLRSALRNAAPIHTLLFGPPATGKTSAMRTILNEISDYAYTSYIRCPPRKNSLQGYGQDIRVCLQTSASANRHIDNKALRFDMPEACRRWKSFNRCFG